MEWETKGSSWKENQALLNEASEFLDQRSTCSLGTYIYFTNPFIAMVYSIPTLPPLGPFCPDVWWVSKWGDLHVLAFLFPLASSNKLISFSICIWLGTNRLWF